MPTLYHVRKDGQVVPVKVSIWDGFKGVPDRKAKPKPCDCCGKVHVSKDGEKQNKSATAKGGNNKNDGKKGGNDNGGGNKGNFSTSDAETYSPADDAKIIEMKEEGKSWKDILEAIGKTSKSQLTNHYKFDLQPKVEQEKGKKEAEDKKKGEKDADKKGGKQSKSEKHNANQQQESKKNQKDKENGKGKKKNEKSDDKKSTSSELKEWAAGYDKKKWLALASKHYDRTGQRISIDQVKKMASNN